MKKIYIVLTQSGTLLSKTIKLFTAEDYNHASLCLDEDFINLYSFGRLKVHNPFYGGFLIENAFTHVFGKFENVPCMIIEKEITEKQYKIIKNKINHFINYPQKYKYDIPNMIFAKTKLTFPHENKFFCSEFVAYIIKSAGIQIPNTIEKMRPYQFTQLKNSKIIYTGELKEWCKTKKQFYR